MMRDPPDIETLQALAANADAGDEALAARVAAIAARERAAGPAPYEALAAELRALGVADLAALAAGIRRGRFDAPGPGRDRLVRFLSRLALQKLRENNPEFAQAKF
jgi:Domain of unknown function (DUF6285)